ncbi:NADH-quinone oxidoreductase subunit C [Streptomyces albus]|nr:MULTISPECIES: NADH-quinone oxidoreductase subunit C [Streptomyces]
MTPQPPHPDPASPHPGWLPRAAEDLFGEGATAAEAYGLLTVDVPAASWISALTAARDELGCTFFDWLSAVDEPGTGFRVCAHLVALHAPGAAAGVRALLLRTTVPHEAPALPTATGVYAGAAWHERETHEMFGIDFPGHPHLVPLLLPDTFEGHPLRKDFVLAARVAKAWPGAKEPGESGHGGPKRRQMLPPGVPDPNEWGPLKSTLPAAPTRERPRRAAGDAPRRTRSAGAGSASQRQGADGTESAEAAPRRPRRNRSAGEGSASQRQEAASAQGADAAESAEAVERAEAAPRRPRRARSAGEGSASQRAARQGTPDTTPPAPEDPWPQDNAPQDTAPEDTETGNAASDDRRTADRERGRTDAARRRTPRSTDAPWHHTRPETGTPPGAGTPPEDPGEPHRSGPGPETDAGPDAASGAGSDAGPDAASSAGSDTGSGAGSDAAEDDRGYGD